MNSYISDFVVTRESYSKFLSSDHRFLTKLTILYSGFNFRLDRLPSLKILSYRVENLKSIPEYLPPELKSLDLSFNQISKIQNYELPKKLEILILRDNQITDIEPGSLPNSLIHLDLSLNRITEINSWMFSDSIYNLDLSKNKISVFDFSQLPKLVNNLNLSNNQIVRLHSGTKLENLSFLDLSFNCITEIEPETFPHSLIGLSVNNNPIYRITNDFMINLVNFEYNFETDDPRTQDIIQRFILIDDQKVNQNIIYFDNQNVHNDKIQKSLIKSVNLIFSRNLIPNDFQLTFEDDEIIEPKVKNEIRMRIQNPVIHSVLNLRYATLFRHVWFLSHSNNEIKKRLNDEIRDGIGLCFTGAITRLVNSLSGFYDYVNLEISPIERMNSIFGYYFTKYSDQNISDLISIIKSETEYSEEQIREYLRCIE